MSIVNMLRLRKEIGFMESILTSIKKVLSITEEYEHFDADLIMHINSVRLRDLRLAAKMICGRTLFQKSHS